MDAGTPSITPTANGVCRTIKFPDSSATLVDFHMTVNTADIAHVAFFTAHMPTEFERDTHYLMEGTCASAADMATATEGTTVANCAPAEPESQNKEYCKIDKGSDGIMKCQQAFFVIQAHHDYCPHDTLTRYEEELFHEWESKCKGCLIKRKYSANQKTCPTVDCKDTMVAKLGYEHLNQNCVKANTNYAFEWAAVFDTGLDSYKWVSQAATDDATAPSNYSYADATMKIVAFTMTGNQKSALFGKKDAADTLMAGTCPEVNMDAGTPSITPTANGVCRTIKFPDSSATLVDFHMTVNTADIAHVAFFTAHMPTEFERDTHYLMEGTCASAADMATATGGTTVANCAPAEPVKELGEAAAHDHGRRLSLATKGSRAVSMTTSLAKRRMADPGQCCDTQEQQGAWELVVAYHDLCEHDEVEPYIEVGFHDYEASCEDYFCNLVGPDVNQLECPFAPPSPPPLPMLPPPPPAKKEKEEVLSTGAIVGIAIAAVVAVAAVAFALLLICKEKSGKPMFTNIEDVKPPA